MSALANARGSDVAASILNQAEHLERVELLAPLEEAQLHQHGATIDHTAGLLDEPAARLEGAAGGEQVIDDQHPVAGADTVDVDMQLGVAVLQLVLVGVG